MKRVNRKEVISRKDYEAKRPEFRTQVMTQKEARLLSDSAIRTALMLNKNLAEANASLGVWKLNYE